MMVRQIVPKIKEIEISDILDRIKNKGCHSPFNEDILSFCEDFSSEILTSKDVAGFPDLQALAFWMRSSHIRSMKDSFLRQFSSRSILVPRGLVFHLPPSNVDTIFIYMLILSLLTGNNNIIRVTGKPSERIDILCGLLNKSLAAARYSSIRERTACISYGHDKEITSAISGACDVRIIWGGDDTVSAIRQIGLPPHASELTFVDRGSFSIIVANEYNALNTELKNGIAERFFNDAYSFDQMACSSPRLVIWIGDALASRKAGQDFWNHLQNTINRRKYSVDTSLAIEKFSISCQAAIDQPVDEVCRYSNELIVLRLGELTDLEGRHSGGGTFCEYCAPEVESVVPFIKRYHQTISHFGLSKDQISSLLQKVNGAGIDRIVKIGNALNFNRFWDGYDLLVSLTRHIYFEV